MTVTADAQPSSKVRSHSSPVRLAIFTSHPIQYQAPLFRALAASGDVHPTVYFGSRHGVDVAHDTGFGTSFKWDIPLVDGYDHVFLPNVAREPDVSAFRGVVVRNAEDVLRDGQHDALLVLGWQTRAHIQMVRAAWRLGIPVLVRGESTLQRSPGEGVRGVARRALWLPARQRLYRSAFDRVDAFLVIGSRNRDYYRSFGVPEEKFYWAPYGVDNDRFTVGEPERSLARTRVRAELGVDDDTLVITSSAKLIARKRPFDLIDAVVAMRRRGVNAHALFIGDGEERDAIEQRADWAAIGDAVTITGFVNQSELPAWYVASDALALPSDSRETWGLVVNEAMAAGLPVVVSNEVGCSPDLVRDNENGFTYPCGDVVALTDALSRIHELGAAGRLRLGERSREIVNGFAIDVAARATIAATNAVCATRERASP